MANHKEECVIRERLRIAREKNMSAAKQHMAAMVSVGNGRSLSGDALEAYLRDQENLAIAEINQVAAVEENAEAVVEAALKANADPHQDIAIHGDAIVGNAVALYEINQVAALEENAEVAVEATLEANAGVQAIPGGGCIHAVAIEGNNV